ncbi:MAG: Ldh family oxidoreductase [Planctomycetes bacterium]|nr:Ldh family oxidoreductase [Planctomycetota bacterium]
MPTFSEDKLRAIASRIFQAAGCPTDEADLVADVLVNSNLVGHDSHGVIRISQYVRSLRDGKVKPGAEIRVVRQTPATAVLDCGWGFGPVGAKRTMALAVEKAEATSISCVTTRNCNHVGRLGEYPVMASDAGMIGIAMVNNHGGGQVMAVYGGRAKRLSPNPISVAIPRRGAPPVLLDITSSVVAEGKLRVKRNKGERVPEGWIVDHEGTPSTDPNDFYADPPGAILPMGGIVAHKGYGLSFVIDILCGALSGAGCSREANQPIGNAMVAIVIKIDNFTTPEDFDQEVADLVTYVKSSPLIPGFTEVLLPGEPEFRELEKRRANGIDIDDETWRQISEAAESVGVTVEEGR